MSYENPIPVAVGLMKVARVPGEQRLLSVVRGIAPFIGEQAFPGGYVNKMESAEQAIAREMLEETGIETKSTDWKTVCTKITPGNQLLIFLRYSGRRALLNVDLDKFEPNDEVSALSTVGVEDRLCFSLHQEVLETPTLWV